MADPLSIAGLALAVVSLGLQVTGGITDYFDSLKSRDQDIASIIQQNDTLGKTLRIIESSISRFQSDHRTATEALRQFLDSCNEELKVLESMVAALITDDQGTTGRRTKARNKGKKLLYPFHRPKLEQMATKLHHINATLQLGLQSLGLSVSHLGSEKLATIQATSQTISSDLLVVRSEVSAISTPIQGIQSTVSQFETRFDGLENLLQQLLVQGSTINGTLQEITPAMVTGRLLGKPAVLQEMCDAVGTGARNKPNRNISAIPENTTEIRRAVTRYSGGRFSCICHHRRHLQRKNATWGPLRFSHEIKIERHTPGCPATEAITEIDRSSKFALTYVGLRSLLNSAIQFSFSIRSGAGGWSLGPNFTYYPIVDSRSAPAFRMLHLLCESWYFISRYPGTPEPLDSTSWREKLLSSVVSSILNSFRAKKASPRAVNNHNQSLVHYVADSISLIYGHNSLQSQADYWQSSPLLDLLQYLLINKAPANDYDDIWGCTPIGKLFSLPSYTNVRYPVPAACAHLILQSNADDVLAYLSSPALPTLRRIPNASGQEIDASDIAVLLYFLSSSAEVARVYGCGPLGLAILSNNLEEVKHLIANHPGTLSERNLFGHTPLHLATDKPPILRVLVEAADAELLNQTDESNDSALELAVTLSALNCIRQKAQMCKRCTCAESAVILLRADCAIPVSTNLILAFERASKRCKLRLVRHMRNRRDRLKQLGIDNLSSTNIEELGLRLEYVLDYNAFQVTQLLEQSGTQVPASLAIIGSEMFSRPLSVYEKLESPEDADIFFRAGFNDTWAWCDTDTMELPYIYFFIRLPFLRWLVDHGGISCQVPLSSKKDIFGCYCIFRAIGYHITDYFQRRCFTLYSLESSSSVLAPWASVDEVAWLHEVHTALFAMDIDDKYSCQCFIGGCTMLSPLLKELIQDFRYRYKPRRPQKTSSESNTSSVTEFMEGSGIKENPLVELIGYFIIYLEQFFYHLRPRDHYATIRYITHVALGIHHSCCIPKFGIHQDEDIFDDVGGRLEDDENYKLELLEDLLGEFEESITSILEDPDKGVRDLIYFWEKTWVSRMSEVLDRLEGSDLSEEERLGAEEIGVVWDNGRPEPPTKMRNTEMGNPYLILTIEHWLYELRKIEEECQ